MKRKIHLSLLLLASTFLVGCEDDPIKRVVADFAEGEYEEALEFLLSDLEDSPRSSVLNGLAAEARFKLCVQSNCFANNPSEFKEIAKHLVYVGQSAVVRSAGGETRDVYAEIKAVAQSFAEGDGKPVALASWVKSLPQNVPSAEFTQIFFDAALERVKQGNFEDAVQWLDGYQLVANQSGLNHYMARYIKALLVNDGSTINNMKPELAKFKNIDVGQLDIAIPQLLPWAKYEYDVNNKPKASSYFANYFIQDVKALQVKALLSQGARRAMAVEIGQMINSADFISTALEHYMLPKEYVEVEPSLDEESKLTAKDLLLLQMQKMRIATNPADISDWQDFIPKAKSYIEVTGDVSLLSTHINGNDVPVDVIDIFNNALFEMAEKRIAEGKDSLPLLSQIIMPQANSRPVEVRLDKAVKSALDKALEENNIDDLIAYASFRPQVAKLSRQAVVETVIARIEEFWNEDKFESIEPLAEFLAKRMDVDFNLDSLLLRNFDLYMKDLDILEQVSADSPDILLQPQDSVQIDLGAKFNWLHEFFITRPQMLDSQLKRLVVEAKGPYGTAVAIYRLDKLFHNTQFPKQERDSYLISSIRKGLSNDESLSAADVIEVGYKLHSVHDSLALSFVAAESLRRVDSMEKANAVWQSSPDDLKQVMRATRPQYTALMEGVAAFKNGEKQQAAEMFSVISKPDYVEYITPYLDEYKSTLNSLKGTYVTQQADEDMRVGVIMLAPKSRESTESGVKIEELLGVDVTVINSIGSLEISNARTLSKDKGKVFRTSVDGMVNADSGDLVISEISKSQTTLAKSFNSLFGNIRTIHVNTDEDTLLIIKDGKEYVFNKLAETSELPIFPDGRYGITEQISDEDPRTDAVLPKGSILELVTDKLNPIQPTKGGRKFSVLFPVNGQLYHPAQKEPLNVRGFFNMNKFTTTLVFAYPYGESGKIDATIRCHILGNFLKCGGHNKHWNRSKHSHIVVGRASESGVNIKPELAVEDLQKLQSVLAKVGVTERLPQLVGVELPTIDMADTIEEVEGIATEMTEGATSANDIEDVLEFPDDILPPPTLD